MLSAQWQHLSRPKDFQGPVWSLTYRPSVHNLQNNSWHWQRVGDKEGRRVDQ